MRKLTPAAIAAALLCSTSLAHAQGIEFLGRMILGGGLTPAPEGAYGRQVTVLTRDDLEDVSESELGDILRTVPGLAISRSGGESAPVDLRIRGAETRHTLVLVDGVRVDGPLGGQVDLRGLQLGDIERVEILRGPQSTFFGSNTIGGVVSITTRRATQDGFTGIMGLELGSFGTRSLDYSLAWREGRLGVALSGVLREVEGYDVSGTGGTPDGMRNRTTTLNMDYDLTDDVQVSLMLRQRVLRAEFDDYIGIPGAVLSDAANFSDIDERVASISATAELLDGRMQMIARFSQYRFNIVTPAFFGDVTEDRREASLRAVLALDGGQAATSTHTLGFGIDHYREGFEHNVFFAGPRQERQTTGIALDYRVSPREGLDLQLGLRRDLNENSADSTTWSAALSYAITDATRLRASIGTAVQNPTMTALYGYFGTGFTGNPNLRPERSFGWDLGIEHSFGQGSGLVSAAIFSNEITDRIIAPFGGAPFNDAGISTARGLELAFQAPLSQSVSLYGTYTYTDARDAAGNRQLRRPEHVAGLAVNWDATDRTRLWADLRHVAGNYDALWGSPAQRLNDYSVVSLGGRYMVNDQLDLVARVNNVFDTTYEEVLGYATPGRAFYVGIQARF